MPHRCYVVDVFAERPYAGNPLAVVIADRLSTEVMQGLAAEFNYSETVFVAPAPAADGSYLVRLFTPAREIAFAGHPILGTAWAIRRWLEPDAHGPVVLKLEVGNVPVRFESESGAPDLAWFVAPTTSLGATCAREPIAEALGISPNDVEEATPVQQCTAGASAMIVPLRSLASLRRCRLDLSAYAHLAAQGFPPLVYVFCEETRRRENDLTARFFFEAHGVREDPATGNAAAFLGAYLLEHERKPELDLRIEQGHELGRPSLVRLRARATAGSREVHVGGGVVPVLEGVLAV